jgi:hypothetical protein
MSSGLMDAPGAFGFLIGVASSVGVSLALALGLADSDGDGDALALGDAVGLGELFFFFLLAELDGALFGEGVAVGVEVSDGAGVALGVVEALLELLRLDVGDSSGAGEDFFLDAGVALGESSGVGEVFGLTDGLGDGVDFFVVALFRFFGGGVGSKMPLSLSPKLCSASIRGNDPARPNAHASPMTARSVRLRNLTSRVPAESLCSSECPRRNSRAGSSR